MLWFAHGSPSSRRPSPPARSCWRSPAAMPASRLCKTGGSTLRAAIAQLMTERAADMADVPDDGSGLLVRQYQGGAPIYKVDTGLVRLIGQLLAHEKQAAEELGQWTEKRDVSDAAAVAAQVIIDLNL